MDRLSGSMSKRKDILEALGFEPDTKLLMIHADDAGLSHAENRATIEALNFGLVNSYSIMVPCPWFYEISEFALRNPNYDYGIHLTLTCEWNSFKFGPILGQAKVPSLVDTHGYFYKKRQDVVDKAELKEIRDELCAQIDRALSFGLTPSHLDSHMYTLGANQQLLNLYRNLGREYKLPVMLNSKLIQEVSGNSIQAFDIQNDIFVDTICLGNYQDFKEGKLANYYANAIKTLAPGLNMILIHTAFNDAEMKAITKGHPNFGAAWRQIDLDFFTSLACKKLLKKQNVQMITWNEIKNLVFPQA